MLDVGANLGQFRDMLRNEVDFNGWIISFEPVSKYVDLLVKRAKDDPKWEIRGHALGSQTGQVPINVTKSPGLNSFLSPRTDAAPGYWSPGDIVATEIVSILRLDSLYDSIKRQLGVSSVYLKLDTQGFDIEVAEGAGDALMDVRALQTEASVLPLYQDMPTYQQAIESFNHRGFELSGMFPVTKDDDLRLVEFDCIMVKPPAA